MKKIVTVSENIRLKSWRNIIVNSEFTNFWVRKYWKRSSNVIYPPIETPVTLNIKKNDDIVCIGRFNQGKRSKKQEVIIQVVIDLIKNKTIKSKLHLIGYIQDNDYFNALKLQSKDYPIYFYDKCSSEKRNEILNNSAIFISACGFEIDEEKEPMYLEHYGISVVEAMSFGCIPLVIGKGGHKETVENKINGYHWQTIEELKENIVELFENNLLREEMSLNAFEKSKLYSYDCLQNSILKLIVK
jgi:glycosyltransferase involved in cell wall biosynthesis